jgi:hemin uptake protein HemP
VHDGKLYDLSVGVQTRRLRIEDNPVVTSQQLPCPHDSIPIAHSIGNNRGDADAPGDSPFDDGRRKMQS